MARVQIVDRRTHTVLLEGDCKVAPEEIRALMARHDITAVDASHVSGDVVLDAPAPVPPIARPSHGRRKTG